MFDTALSTCGVVWSRAGISGVQLPEADRAATDRRLRRRFPAALLTAELPIDVASAVSAMTRLLATGDVDLGFVTIDVAEASEFHRKVWDVSRGIPPGSTMTYGEVAVAVGEPGAARAVGQAMGFNPCPIIVPCHRVVAADGRPGGFSAGGGAVTKMKMLAIEGASIAAQRTLF